MKQVLYTSAPTAATTAVDLPAILTCSRRNNPELGIGGVLVLYDDLFLQLLEGPAESVDALVEFIRGDRRHHTFTILHEHKVEELSFPSWAMGSCDIDGGDGRGGELRALIDRSQDGDESVGGEILRLMFDMRFGFARDAAGIAA